MQIIKCSIVVNISKFFLIRIKLNKLLKNLFVSFGITDVKPNYFVKTS
jgi:hypothetical protein